MADKTKDVTIITSIYRTDENSLKKLSQAVKSQNYGGKITHIFINDNVENPKKIKGLKIINNKKNIGLAASLKKGFKMAKTEIIISLMDDCLPASKDWLKKLTEPLKNEKVAAVSSKVCLPELFWSKFDFFAKALTEKEQRVISPGLDEKGCAYKKSVIKKYGYLDDKNFKNGGEDTDLTIKLSKNWKVVNSNAVVYHFHWTDLKNRIKKEIQYAQISGLVSRKHFFKLPWNFQAHTIARLVLFALLLSFFFSLKLFFIDLMLVFLISNLRFPFQLKRLGGNWKIVFVPFLNLLVYFLNAVFFLKSLIFKSIV